MYEVRLEIIFPRQVLSYSFMNRLTTDEENQKLIILIIQQITIQHGFGQDENIKNSIVQTQDK